MAPAPAAAEAVPEMQEAVAVARRAGHPTPQIRPFSHGGITMSIRTIFSSIAALVTAAVIAIVFGLSIADSSAEASCERETENHPCVRNDAYTPGLVHVNWVIVPGATHYRVGWMHKGEYEEQGGGSNQQWLNLFSFRDIEHVGANGIDIPGLEPGAEYYFITAAMSQRFSGATWSEWSVLRITDVPAASCPTHTGGEPSAPNHTATPMPTGTTLCDGSVSDAAYEKLVLAGICLARTPTPTSTQAPSPTPTRMPESSDPTPRPSPTPVAGLIDYDRDDDGLIDIGNLAQLDAIRYDLEGSGQEVLEAYPNSMAGRGCPSEWCEGFELTADIIADSTVRWAPIGAEQPAFGEGLFGGFLDGNGYTIRGLWVEKQHEAAGMFTGLGREARVKNLHLRDFQVRGGWGVGTLAGENGGIVSGVTTSGTVFGWSAAGGVVGVNRGRISDSSSSATVVGIDQGTSPSQSTGGLVGSNEGQIFRSYATGTVIGTGFFVGGLVGDQSGAVPLISESYAAGEVAGGIRHGTGGLVGDIWGGV